MDEEGQIWGGEPYASLGIGDDRFATQLTRDS